MAGKFFQGLVASAIDWRSKAERPVEARAAGEPVYLGPGNNSYVGDDEPGRPGDVIFGQDGDDGIQGFRGADLIRGGDGDDFINGNKGRDRIAGGDGDDTLIGGYGHDVVYGGLGTDEIVCGQADNDGDRVVYRAVAESVPGERHDTVNFFTSGDDRLDLRRIDAVAGTPDNDAFSWIGDRAFSGAAGELRFDTDARLLQGDVTGDGVADFEVYMIDNSDLRAADIIL